MTEEVEPVKSVGVPRRSLEPRTPEQIREIAGTLREIAKRLDACAKKMEAESLESVKTELRMLEGKNIANIEIIPDRLSGHITKALLDEHSGDSGE